MKVFSSSVLVAVVAITAVTTVAHADDQITKTFTSPARSSRLEACATAKDDAQRWVNDEAKRPLASALVAGRRWTAELDGYGQCDCESAKSATGVDWKCAVDATIRAKK